MAKDEALQRLTWYYKHLNTEGQKTLCRIARSFVSTGEYSRNQEISPDLKKHLEKMNRDLDSWMTEEF